MYLGLDLGTSSLKAVIVDDAGQTVWDGGAGYEHSAWGDRAEIDPDLWWHSCAAAVTACPPNLRSQVKAIGLSGQMHGIVLVDNTLSPVRPAMLWPDRRAIDQSLGFEKAAERTGTNLNAATPGMAGPMLLWVREHEPHVWQRTKLALSPKDWLRARLTGEEPIVSDPSDASATLLYDHLTDGWSNATADLLGVDAGFFGPLVSSDSEAGRLTEHSAEELGLPVETPVAVGGGDAAAALIGLGVEVPGQVVLNVGTGAQLMSLAESPDPSLASLGINQFRSASPGTSWYTMAAIINAGLALTWVKDNLAVSWDAIYGNSATALLHAETDPLFVPFLAGERDPLVGQDASASWRELTSSHDRAALCRSALLGVSGYLAVRSKQMLELTGSLRITLSGGPSSNEQWAQLMATLIGCDVTIAHDANTSGVGAAILAARSQGEQIVAPTGSHTIKPDSSNDQLARAYLLRFSSITTGRP